MELCPLTKVQHRIRIGSPLPFSIRDASNQLLLAKDAVVSDPHELEALVERGACVDVDELRASGDPPAPEQLMRRIEEASRYVPLENLALSPQCGFASTMAGNLLTQDEQWRKLQLVVETARKVADSSLPSNSLKITLPATNAQQLYRAQWLP